MVIFIVVSVNVLKVTVIGCDNSCHYSSHHYHYSAVNTPMIIIFTRKKIVLVLCIPKNTYKRTPFKHFSLQKQQLCREHSGNCPNSWSPRVIANPRLSFSFSFCFSFFFSLSFKSAFVPRAKRQRSAQPWVALQQNVRRGAGESVVSWDNSLGHIALLYEKVFIIFWTGNLWSRIIFMGSTQSEYVPGTCFCLCWSIVLLSFIHLA